MATNQPSQIEAALLQFTGRLIGQLQLRTFQAVATATPVDTGWARSGWSPGVGTAGRIKLKADKAPRNKEEAAQIARSRYAQHLATAQGIAAVYRVSLGQAFISNAVPYINRLNQGYSAQAGARFVERAIETALRSLTNLSSK